MTQFLLFRIENYTFGISSNYLIEILNNMEVAGRQINLRGKDIPIINAHNLFNHKQYPDDPKVLILNINNSTYALPIDDVSAIISIDNINIFHTPIIISTYNKYIKYVIKSEGVMYPVLNLEALV